ncbi:MAG: type IV pilus secretin PilQ [Candidatus Mcinerneyibacterium aminivorans]|uniref:Type IV pilus secretin PilQ n=1 Tax=Candidatus Mcinerneyibacterium aminivorans TaxID=2703815 RepID=A0A5D0MHM9_9BACT|nr:MAG: type IV pilus secretin PilQ [Candidatus Mcinerneyibacterium aminivorans]
MNKLKKILLFTTILGFFIINSYGIVLNSVDYEKFNGGVDVKLNFTGKFKYQVFKLDDPKRVVINLPSTRSKQNFKKFSVNSNDIKEVRFAQFNKDMARVVVELKNWVKYFPEKKGENLVLHFTTSDYQESSDKISEKKDESTKELKKELSKLKVVNIKPIGRNKLEIKLEVEGGLNYTVKEKTNGLILNLLNAQSFLKKRQFKSEQYSEINDVIVKNIDEKDLAVTINLDQDYPYDIDKSKNSISVILDTGKKIQKKAIIANILSRQKNKKVFLEYQIDNWVRFKEEKIGEENKIRLIFEDAKLQKEEFNIPVRKGPVVEIYNKIKDNNVISDIVLKENISYEIYREDQNVIMEIQEYKEEKTFADKGTMDEPVTESKENIKREGLKLKDISVQDANITSLLAEIAKVAGYNIVMSKSVSGKVSVDLHNVTWEKALDIILRTNGYAYRIDENIIRVATLQELKEEVQARQEQQQLKNAGPKEVRIIPISYADPSDITKTVEGTLSNDAKITVDKRTNSIIITDIPSNLNNAEKLINYLDKPTPQVMIKAKFIRISDSAEQSLGINWQLNNSSNFESNLSNDSVSGGTDINVNPAGSSNSGQIVTSLLDTFNLNAKLNMMVSESGAEVLASPKVTVLNNETAHFNAGQKIPITQLDESGNTVSQLQEIGVKLDVTPTINASNEVILDISPEVSSLAEPANGADLIISSNTAETKLLVKDGKTAVIGGLMRRDRSSGSAGVPILKDIPIIGNLFKNTTSQSSNEEILIFVTPYIIRPNET